MLARLRSLLATLLVKTPVRIALGVVVVYFLFAWFAFEPLVKWAGPRFLADKSQHRLEIGAARFDPLALAVTVQGLKLAEPDGKPLLAFDSLFVDFDAASLFRWAYSFDAIRLTAPDARVELRADGSLNWSALLEAFKSEEDEPDQPLPRLLIRSIVLEKGRVALADRKVGFETAFNPLDLTLTDLSTLPDDKGAYALAATTQLGARIRWKGDVGLEPVAASGELAVDGVSLAKLWPYLENRLNLAPPAGTASLGLNYRVGYAARKLDLVLDKLSLGLEGLALQGRGAAEPAVTLDRLALSGGRFDLAARQLDIGEIALSGGRLQLNRDKAGRLDVLDWLPAAGEGEPAAPVPSAAASPAPGGGGGNWKINLKRFALNGLNVRVSDAGFAAPLTAEVGNVQVGFAARAEAGAGTQVRVDGLAVDLSGIRLLSGARQEPLFVLGGISVQDGSLDLAARQARIGQVSLANGKLLALRDGRGRLPLAEAFQPAPGKPAPAKDVTAKSAPVAAGEPWHWQVDQVGLSGFQLAARDETVQPAGGLTLERLEASATGLSDDLLKPLPVKLAFQVKEGGSFQADGRVVPGKPSADLRLRLADLALAPVQPWLAQAANLTLASGRASLQGRLKYAGDASFQGGFQVADLLLNESEGGARFLAWKKLASDSVTASPRALDIDELKLDSLGAKLVIYQDKTVNLKKILKASSPPAGEGEGGQPSTPPPAALPPDPAPKASGEGAFRLGIERIRVEHGELDFADHSLALPFGTRIHDFKGAFNGISSQPGSAAELELDGRVDDYGLARAAGQIDLFNPTGFMDIKTVFRNVEMKNLTPYTATFAGRKIDSGKLSLDLEYKIKDRQLLGENQIIMDKLTLGERVQSPGAKDLPLDLAIAILQDSDGRIDLGLPVSGSLDDPQFSYGQIIWKAIGNILTKIVTAPFRALGALFGGGGEKLEKIAFEAGEADLTPPEKEKFKQIAQILNKRPGLALTVQGAWSADIDRPVMKEMQLRRAVAEKMGVKLAPGEDPGPLSTGNPKVQGALEALYASRFGETEWAGLQGKWRQANPDKKQEGAAGRMVSRLKSLFKSETPLSAEDLGLLKGTDIHGLLYQRLLDKETVTDAQLADLARQRTQAVLAGLAAAGAPAERLSPGDVAAFDGDGREVPARLELGVAKGAAARDR